MDRLIYTALSGASQTLYEQQISANNLANVNTNGFRADMAMATNDKVKGGGFDTRYMAQEGASGVNDSTGVAEKTERPLDVAIQGAGYIAVQDKNGNEVYTRNGNIQQDDQGQLTIDGNLVLGDNGPIILPPNAIASFGSDGTLSVTPDDGDVTATMDIDRLKLVDIPVANLAKNPEGMLITADGVPAQRDENIKVSGGFLEGSNVSAMDGSRLISNTVTPTTSRVRSLMNSGRSFRWAFRGARCSPGPIKKKTVIGLGRLTWSLPIRFLWVRSN